MKVAIIPARGGSKRIPRKNIRQFHGAPIINYSIELARTCDLFDSFWVSTEDPEIALVAQRAGAGLIPRPLNLAEFDGAPDCGTQEVTRHAVEWLQRGGVKIDYVCCIYPTAPLLLEHDLMQGMLAVQMPEYNFAYAVSVEHPHNDAGAFYWSKAQPLLARAPLTFNGADTFKVMIPDHRVCDINTDEDWARAEQLYAALRGRRSMSAVA